jgi:cell division protein FtsW (lipid II flippase)
MPSFVSQPSAQLVVVLVNVTTASSWLQPPAVSLYLFSYHLYAGLLLPALILVVVLVNVTTAASWLQLPAVSILPAVWLNQAVLPGKTTAVVINCVRGDLDPSCNYLKG